MRLRDTLIGMSLFAALAAGGAIGARHALETDHLAAIATLVDDESTDRPGLVGASWGVGHSIPIVLLGLSFLVLGIELPETFVVAVEALVGLVLVALGLRMVLGVIGVESHSHDGGDVHAHWTLGQLSIGNTHGHLDGEGFAVGMLHGVAGSGALVVLLVSTAETVPSALSFLLGFSALSIVTMALVTFVWGRTLETSLRTYLEVGAGVLGILVGAMLLVEQVPHLL